MHLHHAAFAAASVLTLSLFFSSTTTQAENITYILEKHPEFSAFNHYLTLTHLAPEINRRETITICAVDNAGMSDLLSKQLSLGALRNVLSLHVLLDYYDAKKLHQITDGTASAATMYQATGSATGSAGYITITDLKGGKVGFAPQDNGGNVSATFIKSVEAIPYNISVIQISNVFPSSEAEAPAPEPSQVNLTAVMSAHGCRIFAEMVSANPAEQTFESNVESGLTVFCPGDDVMKAFLPKFKNLSADGKESLLEYHGIPVYESLQALRSNNGLTNTLATDGDNKFGFTVQNDGNDVTIMTKIMTAKIVHTVIDQPSTLSIYELDKVLMPVELFKGALPPAPAPTPAKSLPKASKKHKSPPTPASDSDSPADAPNGDVSDQNADSNGAVGFEGGIFATVVYTLWFVILLW